MGGIFHLNLIAEIFNLHHWTTSSKETSHSAHLLKRASTIAPQIENDTLDIFILEAAE